MRLALAVLLLLGFAAPTDAAYPVQVQHAREWARERVNDGQWRCLHVLWEKESGWSIHGTTPEGASPATAAYGIPQALPGIKMAKAERPRWGPRWNDYLEDWRVQVIWGLRYIWGRYGTPCHARWFQRLRGYY